MYETYRKLLEIKGLKSSDVSKETGVSNATLSDWKKGKSVPKADKLIKIAEFLGVSVEYLTTGEEKGGEKYYLNDEASRIAQDIFENEDLKMLYQAAKNAPPKRLKAYYEMVKAMEENDL